MTSLLAIVDTNIMIAGMITTDISSPVCKILDGMLDRHFSFLLSTELLGEYRNVLLRKKVKKLHGLNEKEIDIILQRIVMNAIICEPSVTVSAPDPGDNHLWSLLEERKEAILVTGDQQLIENGHKQRKVMNPRKFYGLLTAKDNS